MFKSKTGVQARSFARQGGTNTRPPPITSIRVEVTGYSIPQHADAVGSLIGKRVNDGKEVEISIKREKVDTQLARLKGDPDKKAEAGSFHGALINADMEDKVPVGSWVVVENAVFVKNVKVGDSTRAAYEANWIHNGAAPSDSKVIEGVMTSDTPFQQRVQNIQVWDDALSIDKDEAKVQALIEDYNNRAENWNDAARLPRHGFRLRAITRTGEQREIYNAEAGKKVLTDVATVLSRTYPIEWVYERGDEQGTPKVSRPISGDDLAQDIDGFSDYIAQRYPNVSYDIEVMPYTSYFTSRSHSSFRVNEWGPLKEMATTPILLEPNVPGEDPEEPKVGKNYGVYGILMIIDDKLERAPGQAKATIRENHMASRFFGNARSFRGELDKLVRAADGTPVVTPPELDAPPRERKAEGEPRAASANDQRTAAANQASGGFDDLADTDTPFDTGVSDEGAEAAFSDAFSAGFDEAGDDAAAASEAPAAAPAPAPAAGRFARR